MSHIVTEACIACRYTDCVEVCPIDCFHGGPNFVVIDPEECIDCGLCLVECPVQAIKVTWNMTKEESVFLDINRRLAASWPLINKKERPLPNADEFIGVQGKINLLVEK